MITREQILNVVLLAQERASKRHLARIIKFVEEDGIMYGVDKKDKILIAIPKQVYNNIRNSDEN